MSARLWTAPVLWSFGTGNDIDGIQSFHPGTFDAEANVSCYRIFGRLVGLPITHLGITSP